MKRIDGYSYYEIAEKYGISEGSAMVIDFRMKKKSSIFYSYIYNLIYGWSVNCKVIKIRIKILLFIAIAMSEQ